MNSRIQLLSDRAVELLLRLFPLEFRWDFGHEIVQVYRDQRSDAEAPRRAGWLIALAARTLAGLLGTALREQAGILRHDISFALRLLAQTPRFTMGAIFVLALVFGVNTAIFSLVRGILLKPLPYRNGEQLALVRQSAASGADLKFSVPEILEYRRDNHTLAGVAEAHGMTFTLLGRGDAQRVDTGVVSANFFELMGVRALHGRTFLPGEDLPGSAPVVVLGYQFWKRAFAADPAVIGETVEMNDKRHVIAGVLPPVPQYPDAYDLYMTTAACPMRSNPATIGDRSWRLMDIFARLKPGVSRERAEADLASIGARGGGAITVRGIQEGLTSKARPTLLVLFACAAFVLLIATANMANLLLARLMNRAHEIAVRTALGAGARRLCRQMLTENMLLTFCGGALGLAGAYAGRGLLVAFASRFTARAQEIRIDGPVLLYTLLMAAAVAGAIGPAPLLFARENLPLTLKRNGGGAPGRAARQLRSGLIALQAAVSMIILIGTALMVRSLAELNRVNPGFRTENVLTMRVYALEYEHAELPALYRALLSRAGAVTNAGSAALASTAPWSERGLQAKPFAIEGRSGPEAAAARRPVDVRMVTAGYFETLGIPLLKGSLFSGQGAEAIVSESVARSYWPSEDPVGRRISFDGGKSWMAIAGVAGNAREASLRSAASDAIYVSFDAAPQMAATLLARTPADPAAAADAIRRAIREIDPKLAVNDVLTLGQMRRESFAASLDTTLLLAVCAVLALALSTSGIGGVVALAVTHRQHELCVRSALGATRGRVLRMLFRQIAAPVFAGVALGIAGSLAMNAALSTLVFNVQPTDGAAYAGAVLVFLAAATIACILPARRALAVEPITILKAV